MAPEDSAVAGAEPPNKSKPQPAIKRQNGSFVHVHEQRALQWLVRRLPQWVTSDMLTLFGVLGSIMTGLGWYWALDNRLWLLMGNLGLFIHWYGDSLDGEWLRLRGSESMYSLRNGRTPGPSLGHAPRVLTRPPAAPCTTHTPAAIVCRYRIRPGRAPP